jgi:hypothetical protein
VPIADDDDLPGPEGERRHLRAYRDDAAGPARPMRQPADLFRHLNPKTREWLGELRADEVEQLKQLSLEDLRALIEFLRYWRSTKVLGKFVKWAAITIVVMFIMGVKFGDSVATAWHWIAGLAGIGAPK